MPTSLAPALGAPATGIIVTGGAAGIGFASAQALAAVGRPVALWDIDGAAAQAAAVRIADEIGGIVHAEAIDLRQDDGMADAINRSRTALGTLGGLVHAAGIVDTGSLEGITAQSWEDGIGVHLRALAFLVQALSADFAANPGSAIVVIASINATLGNGVNPIYSAAKGGMLSLVRSLADRLAQDGVRINAVSPGQILTAMTRSTIDALPQGHFEKRILLERIGEPEEVGRTVRFLLSNEASYVTAAELIVDGGNISSQRC